MGAALLAGCAPDRDADSETNNSMVDPREPRASSAAGDVLAMLRVRFAHELRELGPPGGPGRPGSQAVRRVAHPLPPGFDDDRARGAGGPVPAAFELSDPVSGMTIAGRLEGAAPGLAERGDGYLIWQNALGADSHILRRMDAGGFEDYVAFETAPRLARLSYTVDVERVAGLRLVDGTLEFLDTSGAPRLRMAHTVIVSGTGPTVNARTSVTDCAVDTSPQPPWGRSVTPPGKPQCTLQITWDDTKVVYPALVDPAWTMTGDLASARGGHSATLLASGRVLVAGGIDAGTGVTHASAELYDPTTKTWAATGSMAQPRRDHTAHRLPDGTVLVVAGSYSASSETYNPATGTWTARGNLGEPRSYASGTSLSDGRVLVTAGLDSLGHALATAALFNPQTSTWLPAGAMTRPRAFMPAITLDDGRVLVAGGTTDGTASACSRSAETFDPSTNTWTATGDMATARCNHVGRALPGVALVAGGADELGNDTSAVEIYSASLGQWRTSGDQLPTATRLTRPAFLPDGTLIVTGGVSGTATQSTTSLYRYRNNSGYWVTGPELAVPRTYHTTTALDAQSILVAGGYQTETATHRSAEIIALDTGERSEKANVDRGLRMSWVFPVRGMASAPLTILFNNPDPVQIPGVLRIVASAPDGRTIERNLRSIVIPICARAGGPCPLAAAGASSTASVSSAVTEPGDFNVDINLGEIPIQPINQEGLLRVQFLPSDGSPGVETDNVFYKFSSSFTQIAVYSENGLDATLAARSYATQDDYLQELNTLLDQLDQPIQGRIALSPGTWTPLTQPIPSDKQSLVLARIQLGRRDPFAQPLFGPREDLWDRFFPHQIPDPFLRNNPYRRICVQFEQNFADGNRGETFRNSTPIPASFFKAALFDNTPVHRSMLGVRLPIDDNLPLDVDGCTPVLNLPAGNVFMVVSGEASVPVPGTSGTATFKVRRGQNGIDSGATWAVAFANALGSFPRVTVTLPRGKTANTAATLARIAKMSDNGITPGTTVATVFDRATDCVMNGQPVGAQASGRDLKLCPDAPDAQGRPSTIHNASYKFVIAHELGHTVASGSIPNAGYPSLNGFPALCRCLHVQRGNDLHCLQSIEPLATAASEGFAHFYATRVWNDFSAAAPIFQYYKEFREPDGAILPPSEKIVNVRQPPIHWADTYCPTVGGATEYDFLGFFYSINTAPLDQRTTLSDLFGMLKARPPGQRGFSWADWATAAAAQFGFGTARDIRFLDDARAFGVDN